MSRSRGLEMPVNFIKRIHQALRAYHAQHSDAVLDDMFLACEAEVARESQSPRIISNRILLDGLERLKQINEASATLLQRRFLNEETAMEVAYNQNLSDDIIFQRQRAALSQLALVIWEQEAQLRQRKQQRIEARLEPRSIAASLALPTTWLK